MFKDIKNNQKWFVPGSILKNYDLRHHEAYRLSEPSWGAEYRADYMLLGRNSIGYQLVLVEFENVNVDYRLPTANKCTQRAHSDLRPEALDG